MKVPPSFADYSLAGPTWTSAVSSSAKISAGERHAFLKRLTSRARSNEPTLRAFEHEIQLANALSGRGTARLVESGVDDGGPYLVTEWCDFPALTGRRTATAICPLVRAAFGALDAVHGATDALGPLCVVHGDISPANVLVAEDHSRALLVDFGLANSRYHHANDAAFRGTLACVAPEVARGEPPSTRSDIFALAMALAHAIGVSLRDIHPGAPLLLAAGEQPIDVSKLGEELPAEFASVLANCLEFDPDRRPESAQAVLSRIALC